MDDNNKLELNQAQPTKCLLPECNSKFTLDKPEEKQIFLKHLLEKHKLVIAEVKLVADLKSYVEYWHERFKSAPLTEFCPVIRTNSEKPSSSGLQEDFYLLCDAVEEDKLLRSRLQQHRLNEVLMQNCKEREEETFSRGCLFCRKTFEGNRAILFEHLNKAHNFFLGSADNMVYCKEFLDELEKWIDNFICLYCEKTFKDRNVLKEHMRKKQHKRLNPKNSLWDKYYVINYLELGKNWEQIQKEHDEPVKNLNPDEKEDEWSDWEEEGIPRLTCLFCTRCLPEVHLLENHMKEDHDFDFRVIINTQELSFYQKVKLVNFIRRQIRELYCIYCQNKFPSSEELLNHMCSASHFKLPPSEVWNQPQYYFPTYEDDQLLCTLYDDLFDSENFVVVPDDDPLPPVTWSSAVE